MSYMGRFLVHFMFSDDVNLSYMIFECLSIVVLKMLYGGA